VCRDSRCWGTQVSGGLTMAVIFETCPCACGHMCDHTGCPDTVLHTVTKPPCVCVMRVRVPRTDTRLNNELHLPGMRIGMRIVWQTPHHINAGNKATIRGDSERRDRLRCIDRWHETARTVAGCTIHNTNIWCSLSHHCNDIILHNATGLNAGNVFDQCTCWSPWCAGVAADHRTG